MTSSLTLRPTVSVLVFLCFVLAWQLATQATGPVQANGSGICQADGREATQGKSAMPGPLEVGGQNLGSPERPILRPWTRTTRGSESSSPTRSRASMVGYLIAVAVAIPIGFLIGMSPLISRALDPFIQVMKPISPLAWMPLALYTIKDSSLSAIFVIFICSLWPTLINTAFGVASVRREWLNVARTFEVGVFRRAFTIILPAAAPTILTGMRISIGIAWLVIVAAEMLVGGTGIGYFVWNEWNNLSITNVIFGDSGHRGGRHGARSGARPARRGWSRSRNEPIGVRPAMSADHFISIEGITRRFPAPGRRRNHRVRRPVACDAAAASSPASSAIPAAARRRSSTSWPGSTSRAPARVRRRPARSPARASIAPSYSRATR